MRDRLRGASARELEEPAQAADDSDDDAAGITAVAPPPSAIAPDTHAAAAAIPVSDTKNEVMGAPLVRLLASITSVAVGSDQLPEVKRLCCIIIVFGSHFRCASNEKEHTDSQMGGISDDEAADVAGFVCCFLGRLAMMMISDSTLLFGLFLCVCGVV